MGRARGRMGVTGVVALAIGWGSASTAWAWEPNLTCDDGIATWIATPVPYKVNENGSDDLPVAEVQAIVAAGWEAWAAPCCTHWAVRDDGITSYRALDQVTQNILDFEETAWDPTLGDPASTIGVTIVEQRGNCTISDADVIFNGVTFEFVDGQPSASQECDLQSIAVHEQGHWLGLGHSQVADATMWPTYDDGVGQRSLHDDDIDGVCALYTEAEADCANDADDDCDDRVDCGDDDCNAQPFCRCDALAPALSCGETRGGDTSTGGDFLASYPCSAGISDGPEVAYTFAPTFGGSVTLDLAAFAAGADLDVYLVANDCSPAGCFAAAAAVAPGTPEQLVADVNGDTVYYVVVDTGGGGPGAPFDLALSCAPVSEARCNNGADDDLDGSFDCDDTDCQGRGCGPAGATCNGPVCECPGGESPEATCDDGADNDCDGGADCADPSCNIAACDADGRICIGSTCVCPNGLGVEITCDDGLDNDCDSRADCDDTDCYADPCAPNGFLCADTPGGAQCLCPGGVTNEAACMDGNDNDCDGGADCGDDDCTNTLCAPGGKLCQGGECVCVVNETREETCDDGNDNDCDDDIDCDDADCAATPLELPAECGDGKDNDCDGHADCDDTDCLGRLACAPPNETDCQNGIDDDFNGDPDCEDPDCAEDPACRPGGDTDPPPGDSDPGDAGGGDSTPPGDTDGGGDGGDGCGCSGSSPTAAAGWLVVWAARLRRRRRA